MGKETPFTFEYLAFYLEYYLIHKFHSPGGHRVQDKFPQTFP
jgi:hypothetical protein